MKRFTETCKWDDPWFRGLSGVEKLVFLYVTDRCNNAGFWEIDEDSMAFHTKLKPEYISGAWKGLARGLIRCDGWVWVRRFLRHQKNEVLNLENNAHKQIVSLVRNQLIRFKSVPELAEFLAPQQGLFSPSTGAKVKVTEEDKDSEGSAEGRPKKNKGTSGELRAYCAEIGLPESDGTTLFDKWEGLGWRNDGKPIVCWKSTIRSWRAIGCLPSQKNGTTPSPRTPVKVTL